MRETISKILIQTKSIALWRMALLAILPLLWFIAIRAIAYSPDSVHYHANFELHINGQRDQFEAFTFYEEVAQCSSDLDDPKRRVHLHDNINDIIHVHDNEVTWGHFFANLRYGLTDQALTTRTTTHLANDQDQLRFVLNGEFVTSVANRIIGDEDVLLVDYGSDSNTVLLERAAAIDADAGTYNDEADPAACSGSDEATDIVTRLKKALWF